MIRSRLMKVRTQFSRITPSQLAHTLYACPIGG